MSLRTRLGLLLSLLTFLTATSVGWFSYQSTADDLFGELSKSLSSAAQTLKENQFLFADATSENPVLIDPLTIGIYSDAGRASLQGVRAQVLDKQGRIIAITPVGGLPLSGITERVARGGADSIEFSDGNDWRILSISTESGAIEVGRSLSDVQLTLQQLRQRLVAVVLTAAMLTFILAVLATAGFLRRMESMTSQVTQIAETGVLSEIAPSKGHDEISRLTRAFNRMAERLALSRTTRERFIQDAGHEIKTPLTSLTTNIQVLRAFKNLDEQQRDSLLADLEHEAKSLRVLVDELLDASVDPESLENFEKEPVDLNDLVLRITDRARRRYAREIVEEVPGSDLVVLGSERLLRRAIENIVDNAVKYSPHSRPIEIRLEQQGSSALIRVLDQGPGLPADTSTVFIRRWRGRSDVPGSGLGLAIVRDVIERHGGSVEAANRPEGGAEFRLLLPVLGSEPAQAVSKERV